MQRFDYCIAPKYQIIADGSLFLQQKTLLLFRVAKVKVIKVSCKICTCHDLLRFVHNYARFYLYTTYFITHGYACQEKILNFFRHVSRFDNFFCHARLKW